MSPFWKKKKKVCGSLHIHRATVQICCVLSKPVTEEKCRRGLPTVRHRPRGPNWERGVNPGHWAPHKQELPERAPDSRAGLDLGEDGYVCGWKSRVLLKGEPRRDNIQVLTKAMHAKPSALQCNPSSDSCAVKERSRAVQASGNVTGKQYSWTQKESCAGLRERHW